MSEWCRYYERGGENVIQNTSVEFAADENHLKEAKSYIVAMATPVNDDHTPDLKLVEGASSILERKRTAGFVIALMVDCILFTSNTLPVC